MKIEAITCPNCSASVSREKRTGNEYVCPYCDTRLWIDENEIDMEAIGESAAVSEPEAKSEPAVRRRIPACCTAGPLFENAELDNVLCALSEICEESMEPERLVPRILKALQDKKEAATANSFTADYMNIQKKISSILEPGENLIMFKTTAFFGVNKLKSGMFLTDRRVGTVDGKRIYQSTYRELEFIQVAPGLMDTVYFYPDGVEKNFLSLLAVSGHEFGEILAYIVLKACEAHGEGYQVALRA